MIKALFDTLFPPEQAFLEKVRENIVHDLKMEDTVVQAFGITKDRGVEREVTFSPSIFALIERMGGGAKICIGVYVADEKAVQKYVSLAKGLATAIALLRGTKETFEVSILSDGIKVVENPAETQLIVSAVSRWMEDDEDYQFWKKSSNPYLKWFFEEPDFKSMGRDMTAAICNAIEKCAKAQEDIGNYKLTIAPYGELMKDAFVAVPECVRFETKVVGKLNTEVQVHFGSGERAELKYELTEMDENNEVIGHLIDFTVTLETGHQKEIDTLPYRGEMAKEMIKFLNVWWLVRKQKACEFKVTEKRSSF